MNLLAIGLALLGGGLGACVRFLAIAVLPPKATNFPWAIFIVNMLGSFIAGLLVAFAARNSLSTEMSWALGIGFAGGLTTMSTFAVESIERLMAKRWWIAGFNIVGTMAGGLLLVFGGYLAGGGPLN